MSLIYKSLQQLKSQHNPPGKTSPYARLQGGTIWPWKSILAVTVLTFLMLAMFFFLRQQIKYDEHKSLAQLNEPAQDSDIRRHINTGVRTDSKQTSGINNSETKSMESGSREESKAKPGPNTQQTKKHSQVKPEQKTKPQTVAPSKEEGNTEHKMTESAMDEHQAELSTAFKEKARRNQVILDMEKKLRSSLNNPDRFAEILEELKQKAGPRNAVVYKWQGTRALQNKEFAEAEQFFQKYIQESGPDIAIQINIILAQIGQDKMTEAREKLQKLLKKHPENNKLNNLKTYLTKS